MRRPDNPHSARSLRHTLVVGLATTTILAAAACGSDSPTILNTEKVERAIEHSSMTQRGQSAQVSCPSGVHQHEGSVFSCTALVRGVETRFVVTQTNATGHVRYEAR
jgi:hypothetical protein